MGLNSYNKKNGLSELAPTNALIVDETILAILG
jgi:hypothetical protein